MSGSENAKFSVFSQMLLDSGMVAGAYVSAATLYVLFFFSCFTFIVGYQQTAAATTREEIVAFPSAFDLKPGQERTK